MFPIRSHVLRVYPPVATALLVLANVLVFLGELALPEPVLNRVVLDYGVVPARQTWALAEAPWLLSMWLTPLLSSMFLHGGWAHLLGNMLFLWVFGASLEGRLGTSRFVGLYVAAGIAASQLQVWVDPLAATPMIGASGAIAGVLGAYLLAFPRSAVTVVVPVLFIPLFLELPAIVVLGVWLVEQLFMGVLSLSPATAAASQVAWFAHIGGFAAGALVLGAARHASASGRCAW